MSYNGRKKLPPKLLKALQQEVNSSCPFCNEENVNTFEFHHIIALSKGGTDEIDNLILVCCNCHSKIERGDIGILDVLKKKLTLTSNKKKLKVKKREGSTSNKIKLKDSINTGIISNNLTLKTKTDNLKILAPEGTLGADADKLTYIKNLIKRYQDFASKQKGRIEYKYSVIYKIIYSKFKVSKIELIKVDKFEEIKEYLQEKIDGTVLGRINRSKGIKNYSSYDDFKIKS